MVYVYEAGTVRENTVRKYGLTDEAGSVPEHGFTEEHGSVQPYGVMHESGTLRSCRTGECIEERKMLKFIKTQTVFCAALLLAVLSMFLVPPSFSYVSYLDFRTLALLFCQLLVAAGLVSEGFFLYCRKNFCRISLILVCLQSYLYFSAFSCQCL